MMEAGKSRARDLAAVPCMRLAAHRDGAEGVISVTDNGAGIAVIA
jgi:C4-dicarboxylate-specific signal transduction histidine kinase